MEVAKYGYTEVAEVLLAHGADPNLQSKNGMTALMAAAGRNHLEMAELLLNHNADPNLLQYHVRTFFYVFYTYPSDSSCCRVAEALCTWL